MVQLDTGNARIINSRYEYETYNLRNTVAVEQVGEIIGRFERRGVFLQGLKLRHVSKEFESRGFEPKLERSVDRNPAG